MLANGIVGNFCYIIAVCIEVTLQPQGDVSTNAMMPAVGFILVWPVTDRFIGNPSMKPVENFMRVSDDSLDVTR